MKLDYRVIGPQRKALVLAISKLLNMPMNYLGAPTFAYEVGAYHIDKSGLLTGPDSLALEDALHQAGFDAEGDSRCYDEPDTYENCLGGMGAVESPEAYDTLTIQMPRTGFTPEKIENLIKLVSAKGPLLKAALGTEDLPIHLTEETIDFPWFRYTQDAETIKAYTSLIHLLCETVREKKRVTAKEKPLEGSSRYAFRCFLLSLGFIGDQYKTARKLLLGSSGLSGNTSWKSKENAKGGKADA